VLLDGRRIDDESLEVVERTVVFGHGFGERRPERLQRIIGAWSSVVERGPDEVELLLQGADADTEDHPAVADLVEGAVALGDLEGVEVRKHQDLGGETDALGPGREIPEGGERVLVARPSAGELGGRQGDVLSAREVMVAEAIGSLRDSSQFLDRAFVGPMNPRSRHHW
jgi:hypothetical protein